MVHGALNKGAEGFGSAAVARDDGAVGLEALVAIDRERILLFDAVGDGA